MQCWMKTDITRHTCLPLVMISPTPCESGSRISVWKEIQRMFYRQSSLGNVGSNGRHCQAGCLYLVVTPRKLPIAVLPVKAVLVPVVLLVLVITQWLVTFPGVKIIVTGLTIIDIKIITPIVANINLTWLQNVIVWKGKIPTDWGPQVSLLPSSSWWNSANISIVYSTESLL